jgi:hypothetical protein
MNGFKDGGNEGSKYRSYLEVAASVSMSVKVWRKLKAISYREYLVLDDQSASPVRFCA